MYSMSLMDSKTVATVLTLFYRSSKETLRTQAGLKLLIHTKQPSETLQLEQMYLYMFQKSYSCKQ